MPFSRTEESFAEIFTQVRHQGGGDHGEGYHHGQELKKIPLQNAVHRSQPKNDESEFATLRKQQGNPCGIRRAATCQPTQDPEDGGFDQQKSQHYYGNLDRVSADQAEIDGHSDTHEKQTQEDAAKRLDIRDHLVPIMGIRHHQPGKKRAQRQ